MNDMVAQHFHAMAVNARFFALDNTLMHPAHRDLLVMLAEASVAGMEMTGADGDEVLFERRCIDELKSLITAQREEMGLAL